MEWEYREEIRDGGEVFPLVGGFIGVGYFFEFCPVMAVVFVDVEEEFDLFFDLGRGRTESGRTANFTFECRSVNGGIVA